MDLVNLRIVCIIVTMTCVGIYVFLMIFNYKHRSNTEIKKEKRLNRLNQILKQEQEGIYVWLGNLWWSPENTLYTIQNIIFSAKKNVPKFGLDFFIEYDTGKRVQRRMNKTKEQFDNYAKSPCSEQPRLLPVLVKETERLGRGHSVLMVETSGRGRLTGRQACAVESAARRFAKVVISHEYVLLLLLLQIRDGS